MLPRKQHRQLLGRSARVVRRKKTAMRRSLAITYLLLFLAAVRQVWTGGWSYLLSVWVFTHGCSSAAIPMEKRLWKLLLSAPRDIQTGLSGYCVCLPGFSTVHKKSCSHQSVYISCPSECRKYRPKSKHDRERSCQYTLRQEIKEVQPVQADTHIFDMHAIFQIFSALTLRSKYNI